MRIVSISLLVVVILLLLYVSYQLHKGNTILVYMIGKSENGNEAVQKSNSEKIVEAVTNIPAMFDLESITGKRFGA